MERPSHKDVLETTRCIFRNMTVLAVVTTATILLVSNRPSYRLKLRQPEVKRRALAAFTVSFVALLATSVTNARRSLRALATLLFLGSSIFFLNVGAAMTAPGVGTLAAIVSVIIFTALTVYGVSNPLTEQQLASWSAPLFSALVALVLVSFVNAFILHASWADLLISVVTVVLFSMYVVYDVNRFTRHCLGDDCCLQGTVNLWLDFANIFSGLNRNNILG